jgi:hypothetical protein
MRARRAVGAVGALVVALGAVVVLSPGLATDSALGPVVAAISGVDVRHLLLAGGAVVTLVLLAAALVPGGDRVVENDRASERFERTIEEPPESAVDATPRTGAAFDTTVDHAVAGDEGALERVRDRLGDVVAATLAGQTPDKHRGTGDGRQAVAAGTWTDDRVAAAFLGGPEGPSQSLPARVRHWLAPERERERRIERTVAALERLDRSGHPGSPGATGQVPPGVTEAPPGEGRQRSQRPGHDQQQPGNGQQPPRQGRQGQQGHHRQGQHQQGRPQQQPPQHPHQQQPPQNQAPQNQSRPDTPQNDRGQHNQPRDGSGGGRKGERRHEEGDRR